MRDFLRKSNFKKTRFLFELVKEIEQTKTRKAFIELKDHFIEYLKVLENELEFQMLFNQKEKIKSSEDKYHFIDEVLFFFKELMQAEKDHHFLKPIQIRQEDGIHHVKQTIPLILILHNLRSTFNVGSIIRTSECFGIEKLLFSGYTPIPNHPKVIDTSMQTSQRIDWEQTDDLYKTILSLKKEGYVVGALETADPSINLYDYQQSFPLAVIVGNEAMGIEKKILEQCDCILTIPLSGWKNSLNVGVATALCCYEISKIYSETRIRNN